MPDPVPMMHTDADLRSRRDAATARAAQLAPTVAALRAAYRDAEDAQHAFEEAARQARRAALEAAGRLTVQEQAHRAALDEVDALTRDLARRGAR